MPPETRATTSVLKALPAKASSATTGPAFANHIDDVALATSRPGESLKSETAQAKPKTTTAAKKAISQAAAQHEVGQSLKTKIAAKAVASNDTKKTASASSAAKSRQSESASSKPASTKATVAKAAKTSPTTDAPVAADRTTNNHARDAATRDNKAKGIVAKENSAKSAATKSVVDETSATKGEDRPAIKSVSGVKTSAAAFFAARQKMVPAKAPASGVEEKQVDVVATKSVAAVTPVAHASVGRPTESHVSEAPKSVTPVVDAKAAVDGAAMGGAVKAPVKAALPKGQGFKTLEYIVYPAHGVGQITAIEEQEVAGYKLELFVISFIKDKMILKVPLPKIASVGMRKLAEAPVVRRALDTLTGRARIKRTMWSRRAQEYEAKINSGDLVAIAEVVRDLYRSDAQPEQSYSERQLYEAALDRMAREIAVVQKLSDAEALKLIDDQLQKGPRRTKVEEAETDDAEETDEGKIGEAA